MNKIKKIFSKKALTAASVSLFIAALAIIGASFMPKQAVASGVTGDLHGYAWSDGIGWVSLNCVDTSTGCTGHSYKVTVSADGFSGYAWSDIVGWITFNAGATGVSTCGTGHAGLLDDTNTTTANITGWARVVSGSVGSGADGCISLGGTGYGLRYDASTTSAYFAGHPLTGYAWGDVTTGWLDFDYASLDAGTVGPSLVVTKNTAYANQTVYPGTAYQEIGSFKVQNTSTSEGAGLTNMTVGISTTGVTLSDLTNLQMTALMVPVGSTISSLTTSNSISAAPTDLGKVGDPNNTVEVDLFAKLGTATAGSFNTTLIANGTGLTTGTAYNSGAAITGQTMTLSASLPPGTVVLKANGSTLSSFPTSAGGPVTLSWDVASNVTSCNPVTDTFTGASESYWVGPTGTTTPTTISTVYGNLPSSTATGTVPAFVGSGLTPNAHIYGLNCFTSGGPLPEATATLDVPSPASTPTLSFQVNFLPSYTFPDNTGGGASLSWTSSGMTSCSVDTTGASPNVIAGSTGWNTSTTGIGLNSSLFAITVPSNTSTTTPVNYTLGLRCTGLGGTITRQVTISVPYIGATTATTGTGGTGTGGPSAPPWKEL